MDSLTEHDLRALSNKATADILEDQKKRDALDKRIAINVKWRQAIQARLEALFPTSDETGYGRKWDNVRDAIRAITKARFTQSDVEKELKIIAPEVEIDRARLRSTLWTLQSKGEMIKQVRKGNNQEPALFEKLPEQSNGVTKCPPRRITTGEKAAEE